MSDELQKRRDAGMAPVGNKKAVDLGRKLGELTSKLAGSATIELPRMFHQLVVFVLDGSGSMTTSGRSGKAKGEEIHDAVKAVMERLLKSKNKNCFDVSCRAYSNDDTLILPQQLITKVDVEHQAFDPTDHIESKATYVVPSLQAAVQEAEEYVRANDGKRVQALIILLSDGDLHDEEEALELAEEVRRKRSLTLATIFYETDPDMLRLRGIGPEYNELCAEVMRRMATSEAFFTSTLDPEEVRKHMVKSISEVEKRTTT